MRRSKKHCICGKRIEWGVRDGHPFPLDSDGTPHFLNCSFTSEATKKRISDAISVSS